MLHLHHFLMRYLAVATSTLLLTGIRLLGTAAVLRLVASVHIHLALLTIHWTTLRRCRVHHWLAMALLRILLHHHRGSTRTAVAILLWVCIARTRRVHRHLTIELLRHIHIRSARMLLHHHWRASLGMGSARVLSHLHRNLTTMIWLLSVGQLSWMSHGRRVR